MKLYYKSAEEIEVFKLEPKPSAICEYKIEELNINKPKFFYAFSDECPEPLNFFTVNARKGESIEEEIINSSSKNYLFEEENIDLESFIINYCNSMFDSKPIQLVRKNRTKEILYRLLLTEPFYRKNIMKGIVDLPKSIFLLNLLEKGDFYQLADEDISEQLKLFYLQSIDRVNIESLEKIYNSGLVPGAMRWTDEKIRISGPILEKIKKLA